MFIFLLQSKGKMFFGAPGNSLLQYLKRPLDLLPYCRIASLVYRFTVLYWTKNRQTHKSKHTRDWGRKVTVKSRGGWHNSDKPHPFIVVKKINHPACHFNHTEVWISGSEKKKTQLLKTAVNLKFWLMAFSPSMFYTMFCFYTKTLFLPIKTRVTLWIGLLKPFCCIAE